jgi:hypothetical protein
MRLLIIASSAIALAACGGNDRAAANQDAASGLTAEDIVANDVTAIDAVTADAANIAADTAIDVGNLDDVDSGGNDAAPAKSARKSTAAAPARSSAPAAAAAPAPAANTSE